jgi:hypothetical protein
VKILKQLIKLRKQDKEERDAREGLLDLYMRPWKGPDPTGQRRPRDNTGRVGSHNPPFSPIDRRSKLAGAMFERALMRAQSSRPPADRQ